MTDPVSLKAMGWLWHATIAVDPRAGVVSESEDQRSGLLYRFLPNVKGEFSEGGKLQVLVVVEHNKLDARNLDPKKYILEVGKKYQTKWIDIDNVESPKDDLRH